MTIRANKDYDHGAHDQPTEATEWAGSMGFDTRRAVSRAAAGEAPWYQSYDAKAARRPSDPRPGYVASGSPLPPPSMPRDGALRPHRLEGWQMEMQSPGWTEERLKRANRSDGQN